LLSPAGVSFELSPAGASVEPPGVVVEPPGVVVEPPGVVVEPPGVVELPASPETAVPPVAIVETFDAVTMQQTEHTQSAKTVTTETSLESTGESYSWLFFIS
jgi:hypothetical protein